MPRELRQSRPYFLYTLKGPAIAAAGPRDRLEMSELAEQTPTKLLFGCALRSHPTDATMDKRGVEETLRRLICAQTVFHQGRFSICKMACAETGVFYDISAQVIFTCAETGVFDDISAQVISSCAETGGAETAGAESDFFDDISAQVIFHVLKRVVLKRVVLKRVVLKRGGAEMRASRSKS